MYVAPRPQAKNDPLFAVRLAFGCCFLASISNQWAKNPD
jgi:hypothetical protein